MYVIWADVFSKHIKFFCVDFTSSLPLIVMFECCFSSIVERISFWTEIRISPRFSFCNYAVDFVERSFDLSIVSVNGLSHDIILSLNPFTMLNSKSTLRFATYYAKLSKDRLSVLAHRSTKEENVEVIILQCESEISVFFYWTVYNSTIYCLARNNPSIRVTIKVYQFNITIETIS